MDPAPDCIRFECGGETFETLLDATFLDRCRGTFFETIQTDRWTQNSSNDVITVSSMRAQEFRKIWYYLISGQQWGHHVTITDLWKYREAAQYCCLRLPEVLVERMVATPSYLYIPQSSQGACVPLDTEIKVYAHPPSQHEPRCRAQEVHIDGSVCFLATSLGVISLDSAKGIISLSEDGLSREIVRHVLLKQKKMIDAFAYAAITRLFKPSVLWVELQTRHPRQLSFCLLFISCPHLGRAQVQFMHGYKKYLKSGGFVFLEQFPQLRLHFSDVDTYVIIPLPAPKEADDIIAALSRTKGSGKFVNKDWVHPDGGKCGLPTHLQYRKGAGGKGGMAPLRCRHPRHNGSCLNGESAQDIWVVDRGEQLVVLVHTFDGRVAICQLQGPGGPIPNYHRGWFEIPLWSGKYRNCASYKRRCMVPRAASIEGVLPIGEQIYIFHTTGPREPLKLWKVDVSVNFNSNFKTFFVHCAYACNPEGKGIKGSGKDFGPAVGSWMNWWGEADEPTEFPHSFLERGSFPASALVVIDSSHQDVEVVRFRRLTKTQKKFAVAHTIATPPAAPTLEQAGQPSGKRSVFGKSFGIT